MRNFSPTDQLLGCVCPQGAWYFDHWPLQQAYIQTLTSTFTLPVAIPATVRMVLLTAKLLDSVAFVLMTLISPVIHKTWRCNITNDNHCILYTSDRLQRAVPETPILTYRRPRNLRDLIVRAKVPPLTGANSSPIQHGNFRCETNRCVVCKDHTFFTHSNNTSHCIGGNITCSTSNVIYFISCRVCGIQYVRETRTSLKWRFYGHRSTVNTKK